MKKQIKKILFVLLFILVFTGCTEYLKDEDKKAVVNPTTGQNLTSNILCRPEDQETIDIYTSNNINFENLPYCYCKNETYTEREYTNGEYTDIEYKCTGFSINSGGYEGLWTSIFVKPLAWVIIFFGGKLENYGLGLIITSLLIRLIAFPLTRKTAMQSELLKEAQPEMAKLEKKYENKDKNDKEAMMMKSQEMMAIYKKYNVSPLSGCLYSFIQLPLFIAFLEAINRIPAIFEERFMVFHLGTSVKVGVMAGNYWYILLVVIVGITTYFSFKMNSTAATTGDSAKQTKMMSNIFIIMITIMSIFMTSALGIYWITTNLFTIVQNLLVKRRNVHEKI